MNDLFPDKKRMSGAGEGFVGNGFWAEGCFAETVGNVDEEAVKR